MNAANLPSRATAAANGMRFVKEFDDTQWATKLLCTPSPDANGRK
jgi:hypothetical protein